ncbi:MAG: TIGR03750 family conjugal transfer protein [Herminiimonas sp.]|nr:TIGR03750 family conjugal transfer protein [Herminiimonas sp.]
MSAPLADTAPLTDRINAEPAILRGLSSTESLLAIGLSFAFWIPVSLTFSVLVGHLMVAVAVMGAGPIMTVWLMSGWFQKVKRDRPDYYYQHLIKKWMADKGPMKARFVSQSGLWELGRSLPVLRSGLSWNPLTRTKKDA